MKVRILGSAAGGGFPQWNCNCRNCEGLRKGAVRARPRTQSSIAVAGNAGTAWALVNASPDVTTQIEGNPILRRRGALRDSAIAAVVLVNSQVDHTAGLYSLRQSTREWPIWCTERVRADLNEAFDVLSRSCGARHRRIHPGEAFEIDGLAGVGWRGFPVAGKPASRSSDRSFADAGDNIALLISDRSSGHMLFYAPSLGAMDDIVWRAMSAASCVLLDGTFWSDDEPAGLGLASKRAREMGHLPLDGPDGGIEWLGRLPPGVRKILVHVNNTNPVLDEQSAERAQLVGLGIEVAHDGMQIEL